MRISESADTRASHFRNVAVTLAAWSFAYACYRAYYALGGEFGMIGEPNSLAQWRAINAFGTVVIALAGIVPLIALRANTVRSLLPVFCWVAAVGCGMHALVDITLRVLSVTGVYPTQLPASVWHSFDRDSADLQDLLLNEPWFLVEGMLWAALGIATVRALSRRTWMLSALAACALLTIVGVLSGVGAIGSVRVGSFSASRRARDSAVIETLGGESQRQ